MKRLGASDWSVFRRREFSGFVATLMTGIALSIHSQFREFGRGHFYRCNMP